jgi:rubrerythrin
MHAAQAEDRMALHLLKDRGTAIEQQRFTWREISPPTISKLDCDAWTRVRIILMNGIESNSARFSHAAARLYGGLQEPLAVIRRIEQHQQTLVNWLLPADQTPLETTIGFEQVAIEVTAAIALEEPDEYLAAMYRFGLLEDFDHMYRFGALMDRTEGKDANSILQGYTDILPGRPTAVEHRHPLDDLRRPYDPKTTALLSKLHALTLVGGEHQTHDYYMTIGPMFADPTARQLYAEIASIEEQHVTHYESLCDPRESILEKWLLHEACEAYNYWSCVESESDPRIKAIWERMLEYELGHVQAVAALFEQHQKRDAAEVLDAALPKPIEYAPHREYVREVLRREAGFGASGPDLVARREDEPERTHEYRAHMNRDDQPSNLVSASWSWQPGGELAMPAVPRPAQRSRKDKQPTSGKASS